SASVIGVVLASSWLMVSSLWGCSALCGLAVIERGDEVGLGHDADQVSAFIYDRNAVPPAAGELGNQHREVIVGVGGLDRAGQDVGDAAGGWRAAACYQAVELGMSVGRSGQSGVCEQIDLRHDAEDVSRLIDYRQGLDAVLVHVRPGFHQ